MSQRLALPTDPVERARRERHGINHVVYAHEGGRLATSDVRMNVAVYEGEQRIFSQSYESISQKIRPTDRVRGLQFSPDDSTLYVAAGDTVHAVLVSTGEEVWSYTAPRSWGFLIVSPIALAVAPNGDVAAAFDNGSIAVWDQHGSIRALWHDNDSPRSLFFLKDGSLIAGTDSFSLCAWDVASRQKVFKRRLHDRVFGMAASAFATIVATRTLRTATLWDFDSGAELMSIPVGSGLPLVEFHPKKQLVAFGSRDAVEVVDFEGLPVARYTVDGVRVVSMAFSPDGKELTVGCSDDELRRFPLHLA
jgi:WD40 repeat protein